MRRFVYAIVIFVLLVVLCSTAYGYLFRTAHAYSEELLEVDAYAYQDDFNRCYDAVLSLHNRWEVSAAILGTYISHEDLNEIDRLFSNAVQYAKNEALSEYLVASRELNCMILRLPDNEMPIVKNIF